ncbi:hypothetical protein LCGC14_1548980 [marine sediment metagenome]|uniref:Uncharacterized protein n=1 Tax=marine sediment metagenome TaxID=412755 RepID=A0A0F9JBS6_9ZZZZ
MEETSASVLRTVREALERKARKWLQEEVERKAIKILPRPFSAERSLISLLKEIKFETVVFTMEVSNDRSQESRNQG